MKTKIIYISGGETFEMQQIRAAFDEVRSVLGLDEQTVLFGVPVDCDSALATDVTTTEQTKNICEAHVEPEIIPEEINQIPQTESQPEIIDTEIPQETPIEKDTENTDTVIPILSVLASKKSDIIEEPAEQSDVPEAIVDEPAPVMDEVAETPEETVVISDIKIDTELVAPAASDNEEVEKITIGDMIEDEAPAAPVEKTLEQLLESMTPLREDVNTNNATDDTTSDWDNDVSLTETDTDATLAQLASEFAENEDKIVASPKTETHGKIGKLKNILPFKKAKRDDSSLMGDLFGWAGVAANDDDFSIPGFFTQARKQGS
ncbi:MAG: hypothetical protein IKB10_01035 [Alphaproteobacteria bacterium]|nr:hypothetical protein [Alphaproteobacteria bacterium]